MTQPDPALEIFRQKRQRFDAYVPYLACHRALFQDTREAEAALSRRGGTHPVFYPGEPEPAEVAVDSPAKFLDLSNFRESFKDPHELNARQRLLLLAALDRLTPGARLALFEHGTALHMRLAVEDCEVESSYYTEDRSDPLFQDIQALSYPDNSFDMVLHCDVLEHVPDAGLALSESLRILKPGGTLLFTTPLFPMRRSFLRAVISREGALTKLMPDEIHGDYLTGGILTFHNFGWDLVELMRDEGAGRAFVEMCYAPELGLFSNNCPLWTTRRPPQPGNMLPLLLVAEKDK